MSRLNAANIILAKEIISRYPKPKSALIPLLHLAQEQDGHVANDAMEHLAELVDVTPAEVLGTCSFYEMFKREPVGKYMINICTNISCQLNGGEELLHHAEQTLGVKPGGTTEDGYFTLEDVECIAACTEAPCLQVNYRYKYKLENSDFDEMVSALRSGSAPVIADDGDTIPLHGSLGATRQHIDPQLAAGIKPPEETGVPVWFANNSRQEGAPNLSVVKDRSK